MTVSPAHSISRVCGVATLIGPVWITFIGSLALSFVAIQGHLINRDGILYIDLARSILTDGLNLLESDKKWLYSWPFFSALVAVGAKLTSLHPEIVAQSFNALFLAGACALLVAITRRTHPDAAWAAFLVVLAMPAYNIYRHEILREHGFWFFAILALWWALRWERDQRGRDALFCQLAIGIAAMFRLEAVILYPALAAWQLFSAPASTRLRRVLTIASLPVAGGVVAALLYLSGLVQFPSRVGYYLDAINPFHKAQMLDAAGRKILDTAGLLPKYSHEEAGYILFFGLLSMIPVKFIQMTGIMLVPMAYSFIASPPKSSPACWKPLAWAFFAYLLVLAVFVTERFFLQGRYVSFLHMLSVPLIAVGLSLLLDRFPRWRVLLAAAAVIAMLANVVSLAPKRSHLQEAGKWLASRVQDPRRVYVENPRVRYYADLPRPSETLNGQDFGTLAENIRQGRYDWIVLDVQQQDQAIETWLNEQHLSVINRFPGRNGAVVIASPGSRD